eukprot:scaffold6952_cov75-Phaeocystis_antarctica.AAC.3
MPAPVAGDTGAEVACLARVAHRSASHAIALLVPLLHGPKLGRCRDLGRQLMRRGVLVGLQEGANARNLARGGGTQRLVRDE